MAYLKKTVNTKNIIFNYKYYSARYGKRKHKGGRTAPTSEQQKRINKRIQNQKRIWTICEHFNLQDYYITLTYRKCDRPADMEEATAILSKTLARLSRALKRQGVKLSYMTVTEYGKLGTVHHHVLIKNRFPIGEYINDKLWGYGKLQYEKVYTSSILQLAKYFVKGDSESSEKKYTQSRDIITPKPKTEIIKAERWSITPKAPAGYDVVDIYDGTDERFGCPYLEYIMVKRE